MTSSDSPAGNPPVSKTRWELFSAETIQGLEGHPLQQLLVKMKLLHLLVTSSRPGRDILESAARAQAHGAKLPDKVITLAEAVRSEIPEVLARGVQGRPGHTAVYRSPDSRRDADVVGTLLLRAYEAAGHPSQKGAGVPSNLDPEDARIEQEAAELERGQLIEGGPQHPLEVLIRYVDGIQGIEPSSRGNEFA